MATQIRTGFMEAAPRRGMKITLGFQWTWGPDTRLRGLPSQTEYVTVSNLNLSSRRSFSLTLSTRVSTHQTIKACRFYGLMCVYPSRIFPDLMTSLSLKVPKNLIAFSMMSSDQEVFRYRGICIGKSIALHLYLRETCQNVAT